MFRAVFVSPAVARTTHNRLGRAPTLGRGYSTERKPIHRRRRLDGLTNQVAAFGQLVSDLGPYVVLVILALMYLRYTRQREHEQNNVAIVQAETQNAAAANTASLIQITETTRRAFEQQTDKTNALIKQFLDFSAEMKAVIVASNAAAQQNAAALTTFSDRFASELTGMKTAINAAGEQMTASREATDNRLEVIQKGVEYGNQTIDAAKRTIDTLPQDTTKVVLELGDQAKSDHQRIIDAADKISKQIESLPNYLVKSLTPFVNELKAATAQLQATEARLIDTVRTIVPPREYAAESTPLAERTAAELAVIADMKREVGVA